MAVRERNGWGLGARLSLYCLLLALHGLSVRSAQAYCFARIDAAYACADDALGEGGSASPRLVWNRGCLSYIFHEQAFQRIPSLSESQVRGITQASFQAWEEVPCGRDPFVVQQYDGVFSGEPLSFSQDKPNDSVLAVFTAGEWAQRDLDPAAMALTQLWYDSVTGEIYDIDLVLNLGQGPIGYCEEDCTDGTIDLQNTLTHEAGHVLGLAHSRDRIATMYTNAMPGVTYMRTLAEDDERGLCALQLPPHTCEGGGQSCACPTPPVLQPPRQSSSSGCSVGSLGQPQFDGLGWVGLGALGLLMRLRRPLMRPRRGASAHDR